MTSRLETIRERLAAELVPDVLEVEDESRHHVGHQGAAGGAGHFRVRIVSKRFGGLNRIARHRLVYASLEPLMPAEIHALSIEAQTPEEASGT
jgi:BolA protein